MRGKLPFQHVRWVGGGMEKEKVGRELRSRSCGGENNRERWSETLTGSSWG